MVADCVRDLLESSPFLRGERRWLTGYHGQIPSIENWVAVELARRFKEKGGVRHIHSNAASSAVVGEDKRPCEGLCGAVQHSLLKSRLREIDCTKGVAARSHKHRQTDHEKDMKREIYPDLTLELSKSDPLLLLELKSGRITSPEVMADIATVHAVNVHADEFVGKDFQSPCLCALFVYVGAEPIPKLSPELKKYWPAAVGQRGIVSRCMRGLTSPCADRPVDVSDPSDTLFIP